MGSSETSVVSRVVGLVAARLPAIKLPTETRRAPMRPVKGAVMRQYSISSWASRIWALASSIAACALLCSEVRWSTVSAVPKVVRSSVWARPSWTLASAKRADAVCSCEVACERLAHRHLRGWHCGRGSRAAFAMGEANPEDCRERYHRRAQQPGPG